MILNSTALGRFHVGKISSQYGNHREVNEQKLTIQKLRKLLVMDLKSLMI